MPSPIIAIPADTRELDGYNWHATPHQYVNAVVKGTGATAIIIPALIEGNDFDAILDRVDGVMLSGSRTNVYPTLYGREVNESDAPFDRPRDATALELIRRTIDRGIPLLAICRGIQELNVALGGTLESEIQDKPGNWDHRRPDVPERDRMYAIRQKVHVKEGSCIAGVLGTGEFEVNSLHRQAIGETAPRLAVEAVADDGTIEAVSVIDAKNFAVGVQWHPEYWVESDATSARLFKAFGNAVKAYAAARRWSSRSFTRR
ncbi:gamma-glutamyl-gamma-aminobutyrate hydrolase family protein [Rhizobium sp. KVB221]|uniref:gamma-glutamyl-gamma-aminobutyrate hydrolase n=1 Tax=Rhizobium setariae TaxID=2801340 RepID=A0A936YKX0_9HYPH|nr:gamma-glutamyl-gamma-aminobutyrate hydrolase family protein [Rhizobium setariae]MBL0372235.1 gamma-glutamyl-gamma-aminobutyrate hydrolase family protein [Rhizobium setariae]